MSNQSAKKIKQRNEQIIFRLKWITFFILIFYIFFRILYNFQSFSYLHWLGFILLIFAYLFCFYGIISLAKPIYNEKGELIYGGTDFSIGGVTEYYFDIIYISWFVQITSIFSDWFWFFYLLIPLFAIYKIFSSIIIPFFLNSSENVIDNEKFRKKREKQEKKANRKKYIIVKK
jgi:hypothetical protein